jgi:hypothetical protein
MAGLNVERSSYYFGFVLPVAGALRLKERLGRTSQREPRSQLRKYCWLTNTVLLALCRAELPILRTNKLCGLSVFCLARNPN